MKTRENFSPAERQSEKEQLAEKRWHFESVISTKIICGESP